MLSFVFFLSFVVDTIPFRFDESEYEFTTKFTKGTKKRQKNGSLLSSYDRSNPARFTVTVYFSRMTKQAEFIDPLPVSNKASAECLVDTSTLTPLRDTSLNFDPDFEEFRIFEGLAGRAKPAGRRFYEGRRSSRIDRLFFVISNANHGS